MTIGIDLYCNRASSFVLGPKRQQVVHGWDSPGPQASELVVLCAPSMLDQVTRATSKEKHTYVPRLYVPWLKEKGEGNGPE